MEEGEEILFLFGVCRLFTRDSTHTVSVRVYGTMSSRIYEHEKASDWPEAEGKAGGSSIY